MKKEILAVVCGLSLLVAAGACKKKEEQPLPKPGMPGQQQLPPGMPPHGAPGQPMPQGQPQMPGVVMPKGETTVAIPDAVKGKWKAVVFVIQDKQTNKTIELTANLHSDVKVPNSDLKISVGDFLPDFKMNGLEITSVSDAPNNPAVGIKVFEGGKQIFPDPSKKWGWLYGKAELRNVHPFEHPKYGIFLKNAVKKG